jgi:hypothetical protein
MNVEELLRSILGRGGPDIAENFGPFGQELRAILQLDPSEVSDLDLFEAAVAYAYSYFTWRWDAVAIEYLPDLSAAIEAWSHSPKATLNILCILAEFHYFVVWCFTQSNEEQCRLSLPVMRRLGERFARPRRGRVSKPVSGREPRVVWLATYAESHGPISVALRLCATAMLKGNCEVIVYAWREHDEEFLQRLRGQGATFRIFNARKPELIIYEIERSLEIDRPDVVIADMNTAIPMVLFARGVAPAQIFFQAGPPAWPGPGLDAVFNSFGFDAELAGWGSAMQLQLGSYLDIADLIGSALEEDLAAERRLFAPGLRLVGSYGRLVKVTIEYLQAAERILKRCPDIGLALGGTGDASHIRDFIAASSVRERIFLEERFVSKHVWGRMLTLFLDTWPITGGVSAREVLAKGTPVVMLRNAEMPALHRQRDPALIAADWAQYESFAVDLLTDPSAYARASANASALASRLSDPGPFTEEFNRDIRRVLVEAVRHL